MSVEKMVNIVTLQIQKYGLTEKDMLEVMSEIYNKEYVEKKTTKKTKKKEEQIDESKD